MTARLVRTLTGVVRIVWQALTVLYFCFAASVGLTAIQLQFRWPQDTPNRLALAVGENLPIALGIVGVIIGTLSVVLVLFVAQIDTRTLERITRSYARTNRLNPVESTGVSLVLGGMSLLVCLALAVVPSVWEDSAAVLGISLLVLLIVLIFRLFLVPIHLIRIIYGYLLSSSRSYLPGLQSVPSINIPAYLGLLLALTTLLLIWYPISTILWIVGSIFSYIGLRTARRANLSHLWPNFGLIVSALPGTFLVFISKLLGIESWPHLLRWLGL